FQLALEEDGSCRVGLEGSDLWLAMRLMPVEARFVAETFEQPDAGLWREQLRGYASHEAVASPGCFEWQAKRHEPAVLVFTTEENHPRGHTERPFDEERDRAAQLVRHAAASDDAFLARLTIAADQFLILPENRLDESAEAMRQ